MRLLLTSNLSPGDAPRMSSLHSGVPVCKYTFLRGSSTQANNILQMQPSQEQKRNKAAAERMGGVGGHETVKKRRSKKVRLRLK